MSVTSKDNGCRHLSMIIDSLSDGVFSVDIDRRVTFINQAAENIAGVSAREAIGKHCWEVFRTNVCHDNCPLKRAMNGGDPIVNRPVCVKSDDGRRVPVSISATVLRDQDNRVIGGIETLRNLNLARQLYHDTEVQHRFHGIISKSKTMREILDVLPALAQSDSTLLVTGDSGTGKELIARAVHELSSRSEGPFVALNCGALPDSLLESELFGFVAGAFTDAKRDRAGRFALAEGGTLFLDEIGDVSPAMQVKLLRVLQEQVYEPLGSTHPQKADVRIVAATNKDLEALVTCGEFRRDLFYRINVLSVKVPALVDRREDIPLLIDHFLDRFNRQRRKNVPGVSASCMNILYNHTFPGNVRELENIVEHAAVLAGNDIIRPEHLPDYLRQDRAIPAVEIAGTMAEMEALFLIAVLKRNNWSRKKTAEEIGVNPSTLYRKIKKLGLKVPHRG